MLQFIFLSLSSSVSSIDEELAKVQWVSALPCLDRFEDLFAECKFSETVHRFNRGSGIFSNHKFQDFFSHVGLTCLVQKVFFFDCFWVHIIYLLNYIQWCMRKFCVFK